MKKKAVLFLPNFHDLEQYAITLARKHVNVVEIVVENDDYTGEKPDVFVNFLSPKIHKGLVLECPNVNFHPAPPRYPGRGGASRALFDYNDEEFTSKETQFGATAHGMVEKVDAGPIFWVERFNITTNDTCETLFAKAELACVELLDRCLYQFNISGRFHEINEQWSGPAWTKKMFDDWLVLDAHDEETFHKKIKAARHSRFPGPYLYRHGRRFALNEEKHSE